MQFLRGPLLRLVQLVLLFSFLSNSVYSQEEIKSRSSMVYLNWANDLLMKTDYYYSNGIEIAYVQMGKKSFTTKKTKFLRYHHYSFVQDIFTPINLKSEDILYEDRPFAAYAYGSYQQHLYAKKRSLYLNPEIILGVLGPKAWGEGLQNYTHSLLEKSNPSHGWDNQIQHNLALNLNFSIEKGLIQKNFMQLNAITETRLGTIYTDWSLGSRIRFGKSSNFFNSYKNINRDKWQLYLEVKPTMKIVGYNATLQGGLFNENNAYTISDRNIERIVGQVDFRINSSFKGFNFESILSYNTKEFVKAKPHSWISLNFGWSF